MGKDRQKSRAERREEERAAKKARQAQMAARRRFLGTSAKVAGGAAVLATAGAGIVQLVNWLTPEPQKLGSEFPEVQQYYPEISGLTTTEDFQFKTDVFQTTVQVINFDKSTVNRSGLKAAYNFFETLASAGFASEYTVHDTTLYLEFIHSPYARRNVFVVPADVPNPSWAGSTEGSYHGKIGTTSNQLGDPILTLIRIAGESAGNIVAPNSPFSESRSFLNMVAAVESCHFSIETQTNYRTDAILPPDIGERMQEIVCNSLGRAFSMRQDGYSFDSYRDYILRTEFPLTEDYAYPWIKLPEELYNRIPQTGNIINR